MTLQWNLRNREQWFSYNLFFFGGGIYIGGFFSLHKHHFGDFFCLGVVLEINGDLCLFPGGG